VDDRDAELWHDARYIPMMGSFVCLFVCLFVVCLFVCLFALFALFCLEFICFQALDAESFESAFSSFLTCRH
jgi:hypothetical protein